MLNIFISDKHKKLVLEYRTDNSYWASRLTNKLNTQTNSSITETSISDDLPFDNFTPIFDETITIAKCFSFKPEDNLPFEEFEEDEMFNDMIFYFTLGEVVEDYIHIEGYKLLLSRDVYLHDYPNKFEVKWFKVQNLNRGNGSVFNFLEKHLISTDNTISIGNKEEHYLRWDEFLSLIDKFPTNTEVNHYVNSRITEVLKQYTYVDVDYQEKLNKYREKKNLTKAPKDFTSLQALEVIKYEFILEQLKDMLKPENIDSYTENVWQTEIAKILLLIYPQYILHLEKVRVKDSYRNKQYRELDFVLVNHNGNLDILEIKKPTSDGSILRKGRYRANYVPSGELAGTIMQAEKYVLNLIKWGVEGEDKLNGRYKTKLPLGIKLQVNSPKAILILGIEDNLDEEQIRDFEIIKKKYSNITDIVTYDDLIKRLENTINTLKRNA